jgi:hypothetical protein
VINRRKFIKASALTATLLAVDKKSIANEVELPKQQKINSEIMNLYEWCINYNGK